MENYGENRQTGGEFIPSIAREAGNSQKSGELLQCLRKHTEASKKTIESIMPRLTEGSFKQLLLSQYENYENLSGKISGELGAIGQAPRASNLFTGALNSATASIRTLLDDSPAHIASMLISANNSCVMSVTKEFNRSKDQLGEGAKGCAEAFFNLAQNNNEQLKPYL